MGDIWSWVCGLSFGGLLDCSQFLLVVFPVYFLIFSYSVIFLSSKEWYYCIQVYIVGSLNRDLMSWHHFISPPVFDLYFIFLLSPSSLLNLSSRPSRLYCFAQAKSAVPGCDNLRSAIVVLLCSVKVNPTARLLRWILIDPMRFLFPSIPLPFSLSHFRSKWLLSWRRVAWFCLSIKVLSR